MLREKNYAKVTGAGAVVIDGEASFVDTHTLRIVGAGGVQSVTAERIFINTGALPFVPPIPGAESAHVYTSETMMELDDLPEKLVIIGGGYIGLEFASYYENFGSSVAVVQDGDAFIPREDSEISARVLQQMNDRGIHILTGAKITRIEEGAAGANVIVETAAGEKTLAANAILIAIKELQERTMIIRENIVDKQRVCSNMIKSILIPADAKAKMSILIKDINSLFEHLRFSFDRLEYMQDTFLGLVNIQQNKIIKIFTIVSVVFMPPTLVASIYGMNFKFMPELEWKFGYPFAIVLMICGVIGILWYFKRKKWF